MTKETGLGSPSSEWRQNPPLGAKFLAVTFLGNMTILRETKTFL